MAKRKKNISGDTRKGWKDITLAEFMEIRRILSDRDADPVDQQISLLSIVNNISTDDLMSCPVSELRSLNSTLDFLTTSPAPAKTASSYRINSHDYRLLPSIAGMTVAQYVDFQTYAKHPDDNIPQVISIFLIPESHEYNDGYDMVQVLDDIRSMPVTDALGIAFFFTLLYLTSTGSMISSARRIVTRTKTSVV